MKGTLTYLNFDGNCKAAMEFYARSLGGELASMPFADMPGDFGRNEAVKDRLMHSRITLKGQPVLMASDTMPGMPYQAGNNFSVMIGCESMEEIQRIFAALSESGSVIMPLQDQFWGAHFGMLKDQFGVHWMLAYERPQSTPAA